jgi:Ca-activated chloride channel homolog
MPMIPLASLTLLFSALLAAPQAPEARQASVKRTSIQVDVDLVLVHAAVTDNDGRSVTGLDKTQFQLWEDKVQQEIRYFSAEEVPVSLGVIFDVSSSMADKLAVSRDAVTRFLTTGIPEDEYALIEFNSRPQVTQDFTSNIADFQNRMALASASGSTALYDAVYLGIERVRNAHNRRKALLLVTDGEDNHSHYTLADLKELAKESDVQIFAIGMGGLPITTATKGHKSGRAVLQELVDLTGGEVFFTTDVRNLDDICSKISESLRNEYIIGYASTNTIKDGKWRRLHLKVNEVSHVKVHARNGYYARVD